MYLSPTVSIVTVPECAELARGVHRQLAQAGHDVRDDVILVHTKIFADGNARPKVMATIRRTEVYFFYTMPHRQPEMGMARLAQILNAIHLADPISIRVVMPYFEGRQDRKDEERTPATAKVMARMIEGERTVRGLITFDLHSDQLMLAFENPVENLWGQLLLARYAKQLYAQDPKYGVVAADVGSAKRARKFATKSGYSFRGIIDKERLKANEVERVTYIGLPIDGYHIILPDDMIDTGGTIVKANEALLAEGALSTTAYATHWVASPKGDPIDPLFTAEAKFRKAGIRVVTTDTIPRTAEYLAANADFLTVVPCGAMIADAIGESLTPGGSVSKLGV